MSKPSKALYVRIKSILESARANVARTVNSTQVAANWLIGREIVEDEQAGRTRAVYGTGAIKELSKQLSKEYGNGYSVDNLELFRRFYTEYPRLISEAATQKLPRRLISEAVPRKLANSEVNAISLRAGLLNPNLSWTHYRMLLKVDKPYARSFYEVESTRSGWSSRQLERQINSLLYERLALSKDKKGLLKLAQKGQAISKPADVFKDPVVIEFLGLPESPKLVESRIEEALINNLQAFLLEMGRGFAFIARQERLTLVGDHFYVDLVFYHTILKCYILIDLKTGKLTHGDLGQLQLYVNYYDQERKSKNDNPTLGLILCTDKNDAVVKYTLGPHQERKIFTSRYKLHLPTEKELKSEMRRELKEIRHEKSAR